MANQIDHDKLKDDLAILYKNTKSQDQFKLACAKSAALSQSKRDSSSFWPVVTLSSFIIALLMAPSLVYKSNDQIIVGQMSLSSNDAINEVNDDPIFYYWLDLYDNELIAVNDH
ncbi:MAG: hypothetical protein P8Q37_06455 [Porticoccaceae bacterium]|nr:hypothetical protein [Porticoccaceae bacterium]MDG1474526.1 hypothetical protein [Porticoccaceae bacterium]